MKQLERKDLPEVSGGSDSSTPSYDVCLPIDPIGIEYPQNPIVPLPPEYQEV